MEIYRIKDMSFSFPGQAKRALAHIDLSIADGQFITVAGRSGCGKSTLLRHLKTVLTPHGVRTGELLYKGKPLAEADQRTQASEIGFVLQNPDNQLVTDKVWHELAFGLESLGLDQQTMRLRAAEMASFFGIQGWFHREVAELSGGQKQLLNLASIMAMHPSVLVLDEPTSQLDPIAASEFLETVHKINRELGTTVIMSEHRLEEALLLSDRFIVLDEGAVLADDTPRAAGEALRALGHPMFAAMPAPMRIYAAAAASMPAKDTSVNGRSPLTIKEGRQWLDRIFGTPDDADVIPGASDAPGAVSTPGASGASGASDSRGAIGAVGASGSPSTSAPRGTAGARSASGTAGATSALSVSAAKPPGPPAQDLPAVVRFKDVWFKYEKNGPDIVKGLSFEVLKGQFYCIVGGNGTGKSTALSLLGGMRKPYRGKVLVDGRDPASMKASELFRDRLGMLPQNPQSLFVQKTVELELYEMLGGSGLSRERQQAKVREAAALAELEPLLAMHPYDLSGGEQQRAALAKVLLLNPSILVLDEPTKGLDAFFKEKLGRFLQKLNAGGVTVIMVSHDIEFCAKYGEVCAMFFDGGLIASNEAKAFFAGNHFYTTAANRMARRIWNDAVTTESVIERCRSSR